MDHDTPTPIVTPIPKKRGPIVEDVTVIGGTDATTGAPVIRPKTVDGQADESTVATDPCERRKTQR